MSVLYNAFHQGCSVQCLGVVQAMFINSLYVFLYNVMSPLPVHSLCAESIIQVTQSVPGYEQAIENANSKVKLIENSLLYYLCHYYYGNKLYFKKLLSLVTSNMNNSSWSST